MDIKMAPDQVGMTSKFCQKGHWTIWILNMYIFSDGCCNTYKVTSTCRACYFWVVYGNAEMLDQTYERVDDLSNVIPLVNGSSSNIDYVKLKQGGSKQSWGIQTLI